MIRFPDLPVTAILDGLAGTLEHSPKAVLVAPPGAGKTTLVPLRLLSEPWLEGRRILLLEPRRLAARAAARRMASLLGEKPGETVGYVMRLDRKLSAATRIVVVTEGVFTRMALDDPELTDIGAVLFDEFHERSLDADFGLALALDIAGSLRPDLRLLVMSATLHGQAVSQLLDDAPVLECPGRAFPVDNRYRNRAAGRPVEDDMANAIADALANENGSVLAFLPGQAEIRRTQERLAGRTGSDVDIYALHGGLEGDRQDAIIRPSPPGRRKVVLATAIAESSITIDDVRIVIDSGLSRLPRYEPATGVTRLETVRVSRSSAAQRAGRAGRTAPGIAIRLWNENQSGALAEYNPPEISQADLSGLLLDCAAFGVTDPAALRFPDAPPQAALSEARTLLATLGALDARGHLTPVGKAMRRLALPVRLAHMVTVQTSREAALMAARLAMVITERGLGGPSADLARRLHEFETAGGGRARQARAMAARLAATMTLDGHAERSGAMPSVGALLAAAYPDRIARARGQADEFVLANGRGCHLDDTEPLAREPWLVVADLQGKARSQRIAAAAAITEAEIRALENIQIASVESVGFDAASGTVRATRVERLGAITLSQTALPAPHGPQADKAILDAIRDRGLAVLNWTPEAENLRTRLRWLNEFLGPPWPDVSDDGLAGDPESWLAPFLTGEPSVAAITGPVLCDALRSLVPPEMQRRIDDDAPQRFVTPEGTAVRISYDGEEPVLPIRVQLLYGLKRHPAIGGGRVPLVVELLSPAGRPIQKTRDLPGFWSGSWADVRAEMRGRYPKHVWPDDPANAEPTARAKPRR